MPRSRLNKLNRRELLRVGSVAALGGLSLGCPIRNQPQTAAFAPVPELPPGGRAAWASPNGAGLARVDVSAAREIRTIVGLRPFRPSGFRVEVERLGDKLLAHNYGHGGGGVSLSWGTSHLAMEEALAAVSQVGLSSGWSDAGSSGRPARAQIANGSCAVLGCGVMGLSTAILMQRAGWKVTIYTKDVPPHTTSNVAGALWGPTSVSDPGQTTGHYEEQFVRAARLSQRYFQEMVGSHYSVRWIENYSVSNSPQPQPWFERGTEDLYPDARQLTLDEFPFPHTHARSYKTMLIEPHGYLSALVRDFLIASGQVVVREFTDLGQVAALDEPLVFNCTGLGAKELVGDDELGPIRGQLTFLLPQPEVDYTVIGGGLYMFPRSDGILLGGTFERGNWSTDPDPDARRRILQGHRELFRWDAASPAGAASPEAGVQPLALGF